MKYIIILLSFSPVLCFSQKKLSQDSIIKRWKKATMNLECTRHKFSHDQVQQIVNNIKKDTTRKYSKNDLWDIETRLESTEETITGTAVFISDGNLKYLVSAKHVLIANNPYDNYPIENISNRISITTSIDAYNHKQLNDAIAMNLSAGTSDMRPFVFSQNDVDLGIISLQSSETKDLLAVILKDGLEPIPTSSIDTLNNHNEGELIMAFGFPTFSLIGQAQPLNRQIYQNTQIVSPVITFGNIGMINALINYFIGDITVYPGNSGGPVVSNNKLIGIVSAQLPVKTETDQPNLTDATDHIFARGTLAKITKAANIISLLKQMQYREKGQFFR